MLIETEAPFTEYTGYKNFHKRMGRWQVCLVSRDGKRKTLLFSKYLMSVKVGRSLTRAEEVDHKDGDKTNDHIDNLEIVTRAENRARQAALNQGETLKFTCPSCGNVFERKRQRAYQFLKFGKVPHCSRTCGNKRSGSSTVEQSAHNG